MHRPETDIEEEKNDSEEEEEFGLMSNEQFKFGRNKPVEKTNHEAKQEADARHLRDFVASKMGKRIADIDQNEIWEWKVYRFGSGSRA